MARAAKKKAKKKAAKRTAKTVKSKAAKTVKSKRAKRATSSRKASAKKPAKRTVAKKTAARKKARRAAPRKTKAERAHETLVANARHALELKNAAPKPFRPENRTAHQGMTPLPNDTIPPAGGIEAEEVYIARERAHKSG
jgi:hypothetical protein